MADTYSLYDAKARLSEIVRKVREGRTVTITYRGEPVAEVRPARRGPVDAAARLTRLIQRGVVVAARRPGAALEAVARRPGALARFLRDRNA